MTTKFSLKARNIKGIWFFGLAGSGKTYASNVCAKFIKNGFLIDGDQVRKLISYDLGFTVEDRAIQLRRVLGLAEIANINGQFPIISTVSMTEEILRELNIKAIEVVEILRPLDQLLRVRSIYQTDINVMGKDIQQVNLDTVKLHNYGNKEFGKKLEAFIK